MNADAALNKIYKQLAAKLDGKEKTALRDAQRAWIAFRDKECEYRTIGDDGGSIRPMELAMCARDMTEARAKALRARPRLRQRRQRLRQIAFSNRRDHN